MASGDDPGRLTFGIYPGSAVGDDTGQIVSGPPDDPTRIAGALEDLQGRDGRPLLIRAYRVFADAVIAGVSAAKDEARRLGHHQLQVGINTTMLLSLAGYTHFSLRDADSGKPGLFHQFGLMTDDYTPKPAFHAHRELIDRYST